jgi:hypothetical protein
VYPGVIWNGAQERMTVKKDELERGEKEYVWILINLVRWDGRSGNG